MPPDPHPPNWEAFVRRASDVIRRRNGDPNTATFLASVTDHGPDGLTAEVVDFNAGWTHRLALFAHLLDQLERGADAEHKPKMQQVARLCEKLFGMKGSGGPVQ